MSDESTDRGEGAHEALRQAATRAREIVVHVPDPPSIPLGDVIEGVDPDVMYQKLAFGEDGELPPPANLEDGE